MFCAREGIFMAQNNSHPEAITIGHLSSLAQVDVGTVRFYERSGLLQAQDRTRSGYRLYSRNSLARIQFICRARETGYSLDEIKKILQLHDQGGPKAEVEKFTVSMIAEIDEKIHALSKWRQLFSEISDYIECSDDSDHIDAEAVDTLMRSHCNMMSRKDN
jgi:MerR family mercuric resistance operon transcriptional regulator